MRLLELFEKKTRWRDESVQKEARRMADELFESLESMEDRELFTNSFKNFINREQDTLVIPYPVVKSRTNINPPKPLTIKFYFEDTDKIKRGDITFGFIGKKDNNILNIRGLPDLRLFGEQVEKLSYSTTIARILKQQNLDDGVVHELVHFIDSIRWGDGYHKSPQIDPGKDIKGYINSPAEMNAYYHQMVDVFRRNIKQNKYTEQELKDFSYVFNHLFDTEFEILRDHLSDENKKRFKKRFYGVWKEKVAEEEAGEN